MTWKQMQDIFYNCLGFPEAVCCDERKGESFYDPLLE